MKFRDMSVEVLRNLVRRKLRTCLTVLGITIGALTVAIMVALGSGLQTFIHSQIRSIADPCIMQVFGAKDLPITSFLSTTFGRLGQPPRRINENGFNPGAFNLRYFKPEEVEALSNISHVEKVAPAILLFTNYIKLEEDERKFEVVAIPEGEGFKMDVESGPGFSNASGSREVVLAYHYLEAFGANDPKELIGKKVYFSITRFPLTAGKSLISRIWKQNNEKIFEGTIVGFARKTILSMAAYLNHDFALEMARFFLDDPELYTKSKFGLLANLTVDSKNNIPEVKEAVMEMGLTPLTIEERIGILDTLFVIVQTGLSVFGVIALVVAGLGIANTLLMATYERRREIGLHKALGMTNSQIRSMFALEAIVMGVLGGILGVTAAYVAGTLGNLLAQATFASAWDGVMLFAYPWWLFLGILLFSAVVGLLAGLYPASRAARMDPISALRSE